MFTGETIPLNALGVPTSLDQIKREVDVLDRTPIGDGDPLPIHRSLSSSIEAARTALMNCYGGDIERLAKHVDGPDRVSGMSEILAYASTPRTVKGIDELKDSELLQARARAVGDFLTTLVEVTHGEPYILQFINQEAEGQSGLIVRGKVGQDACSLSVTRHDELAIRTPLLRTNTGKMHADGVIPIPYMALRDNGDIISLSLTPGVESVRHIIADNINKTLMGQNGQGKLFQLFDLTGLADSTGQTLTEYVPAEDLTQIESQFCEHFVDEWNDSSIITALEKIIRLGDPSKASERLSHARQLVLESVSRLRSDIGIVEAQSTCNTAARKLVLISRTQATVDGVDDKTMRLYDDTSTSEFLGAVKEVYQHARLDDR